MTRQITLTENSDGRWTAYDTATKTVTHGTKHSKNSMRRSKRRNHEPSGDQGEINPDDPLFSGDPIMSVDMGDETIDDVLYGATTDTERGE